MKGKPMKYDEYEGRMFIMKRTSLITMIVVCLAIGAFAGVAFGEEPPSIRIPESVLRSLEARVDVVEGDVELLKDRVSSLEGKTAKTKTVCPCRIGGECICSATECECPGCPKHTKYPQATGVKLLGFKTSWCVHCPGAEKDCEGLAIEWMDADTDPRAKQYHVTEYPALVRLIDGKKDGHFVGRTGMANKARGWLNATEKLQGEGLAAGAGVKPVGGNTSAPAVVSKSVTRYGGTTWTWPGNLRSHLESEHGIDTSGLSDSELRTVHDNLHNTGRSGINGTANYQPTVRYMQPVRYTYQPRTYYRSAGYCPNCVR